MTFFEPKKTSGVYVAFFLMFLFGTENLLAAQPKPVTIIALGDSTTAGTPAFRSPVEAPPAGEGNEKSQYAYWMMMRNSEYIVFNRGVNGERTEQIFERFKKYVTTETPDAVIVLAGVNDLYQGASAEEVEVQLQKIYALKRERG